IADTNIPLVELMDGEVLVLEAIIKLGYGKDHAKWQAGVACGYKNTPQVDIVDCDACGKCVKECPHDILGVENNRAMVLKESECILCKLCVKACEIDGIKVSAKEDSFIFSIESDGSYSASDLVLNAAADLSQKATQLKSILELL
ncbi:MAG: DNA-directed RNA polymerase subunit D, partial [Methanosarcinales archaeon]|nr:DNA-directed RNA polymerase subunit D [Methanosarcinales archaeon]